GAPLTLVAGGGLTIIALGVVLAWYPDLWRLRIAAVETPEGALRPVTEAERPPDR
ncbi:MAG: hypothetical protein IVW53_07315, partial [Chloroflexi bacterium]|nr:hypothetical protein [Chloroflexota bacterium]